MLAGSPSRLAESSSSSYGLVVRLLLLPTPSHDDAVTGGYGPESVCPKGTFTPLTIAPFGRANTPLQWGVWWTTVSHETVLTVSRSPEGNLNFASGGFGESGYHTGWKPLKRFEEGDARREHLTKVRC